MKTPCVKATKREQRPFGRGAVASCLVGAMAILAPSGAMAGIFVSDCGNAEVTFTETSIVYTFKQSDRVSIKGEGRAELLLVGGGGGGGGYNYFVGGGGGGGGVFHSTNFTLSAGTYDVTVGAGATASTNLAACGNYGGDSSAFGITALGGAGGEGGNQVDWQTFPSQTPGGCGGGASVSGNGKTNPSKSAYKGRENDGYHGHDGGGGDGSSGSKIAGGGGGAGAAGQPAGEGGAGGDGYLCAISGTPTYYGGGGAGGRTGTGGAAAGGLGGGGATGQPGADGFGGGGGGSNLGIVEKNYNQGYSTRGGSGIVILSIPREDVANESGFALFGGETVLLEDAQVQVFRTNGTLTVEGDGFVEALIVGGGGAGGGRSYNYGGGGGGGGVFHLKGIPVAAGVYDVTVGLGGAGGDVARNGQPGGESSVFGIVVKGGGGGATGNGVAVDTSKRGCGGGATQAWGGSALHTGGVSIYGDDAPFGFHGHNGASVTGYNFSGGGGGAGGAAPDGDATQGGQGGIGYRCSILGVEEYFGGGGSSGGSSNGGPIIPGGIGGGGATGEPGTDGFGGGGGGGKTLAEGNANGGPSTKGGDGVVILRVTKKCNPYLYREPRGGNIAVKDGWRIHTFSTNGVFTLPRGTVADVLLVGGGGGGGSHNWTVGGGGGGGGVYHATNVLLFAGSYNVTVGTGAPISTNILANGNYGGDSSAFGITVLGGAGGEGGNQFDWQTFPNQAKAGCGGGGTVSGTGTSQPSKSAYTGKEAAGYHGHDGGGGDGSSGYKIAGGGGGAGAAGQSAGEGGAGGDGYLCDISGAPIYYGGGGAGGNNSSGGAAAGGLGGGGATGEPGVDGLGGGGGGAKIGIAAKDYSQGYSTKGGSGVVIVRYRVYGSIGTKIIVK